MATPSRQRIFVLIAAIVAVFFTVGLPFLRWLAGVWIDWLWYGDLGQQSVFLTRIVSQIVTGVVFGVATFLLLYVNLRIARRMAPKAVPIGMPEGTPEQLEMFIESLRGRFGPILDRVVLWGCLVLAFFNGLGMSSQWQTFRLALASVPFPYSDPQFNRNVGFFVFELPAYNALSNWLTGVLILTAVLTLAVHVIDGAIQPWAKFKGFAPHVKAHLSVLMAFIVLAWGFRYWISIWELNYSRAARSSVPSYTDVHAQLPAYWMLIVVSTRDRRRTAAQHPLQGLAPAAHGARSLGRGLDTARCRVAGPHAAVHRRSQRGVRRDPLHRAQHRDDAQGLRADGRQGPEVPR